MAKYIITNKQEPILFEECKEAEKRALQNAKNLLMLRMGEVPFDRLRGFDPALYEMPITRMQEELMPEVDRVLAWEPDARAESARCYLDDNDNTVIEVVVVIGEEDA